MTCNLNTTGYSEYKGHNNPEEMYKVRVVYLNLVCQLELVAVNIVDCSNMLVTVDTSCVILRLDTLDISLSNTLNINVVKALREVI